MSEQASVLATIQQLTEKVRIEYEILLTGTSMIVNIYN